MDISGDTMRPFEFENCVALGLVTDDGGSYELKFNKRKVGGTFDVSDWYIVKQNYEFNEVVWYAKS